MDENQNNQQTPNPTEPPKQRERIALLVTWLSVGGTVAIFIGAVTMISIKDGFANGKDEFFKYIIGILLPLWGTWMGTILAFYFSKENLDAANKTVRYLTDKITSPDEKLKSIKVKDVMIKNIISFKADDSKIDDSNIYDLLNTMDGKLTEEGKPLSRLPIVNNSDILKYIIHRGTFDSYLISRIKTDPTTDLTKLTIKDMKNDNDPTLKKIMSKDMLVFVSEQSSLRDAQILLDKIESCKDVFVTPNGTSEEKIIGWITDTLVSRVAKT